MEYNISDGGRDLTFYIYDSFTGILHSVAYKEGNKLPTEKVLFETKNINNYLVTNLMPNKTFLIFSNNVQNTLTFEKN